MANRTYAKEWLSFAKKNLDTANLLFSVNHYEDIIGIEIQQCIEKTIKSINAYFGIKIPKEHDLVKLYFVIEDNIKLNDEEIVLLKIATNYYKEERYPNPNYSLPPKDEIKQVLSFAQTLFFKICTLFEITINSDKL